MLAFDGQGSERLSNSRASEGNSEHTYLWAMNDSINKHRHVPPPWGDDMESALIAQDRVLRSRVKAASSPHAARRIRAGIVFVICATALFGVLLTLFVIWYASRNGDNTMNGPHSTSRPSCLGGSVISPWTLDCILCRRNRSETQTKGDTHEVTTYDIRFRGDRASICDRAIRAAGAD